MFFVWKKKFNFVRIQLVRQKCFLMGVMKIAAIFWTSTLSTVDRLEKCSQLMLTVIKVQPVYVNHQISGAYRHWQRKLHFPNGWHWPVALLCWWKWIFNVDSCFFLKFSISTPYCFFHHALLMVHGSLLNHLRFSPAHPPTHPPEIWLS